MKDGISGNRQNPEESGEPIGGRERAEYDQMLVLERLESLEEDMEELGVASLDEVRRRIAELHELLDHGE